MTDCGKRGFDRMGRSQVNLQCSAGESENASHASRSLAKDSAALGVLGLIGLQEQIKRLAGVLRWFRLPDIVRLDFACRLQTFALEGTLVPWNVPILEQLLPSSSLVVLVAKRVLLPSCDGLS